MLPIERPTSINSWRGRHCRRLHISSQIRFNRSICWWQIRGTIVNAKVSTFNQPKAHCISSQQLLQGCFNTLHVLKLSTIFSSKGTSTSCPFRYVLSRSLTLSIRLELLPSSTKCWNTCSFHDKLESCSEYKSAYTRKLKSKDTPYPQDTRQISLSSACSDK